MSAVDRTHKAKREERIGNKTYDTMNEAQQEAFDKKFPNNPGAKAKAERNKGKGEDPANPA